jgi:hypothetical protein
MQIGALTHMKLPAPTPRTDQGSTQVIENRRNKNFRKLLPAGKGLKGFYGAAARPQRFEA